MILLKRILLFAFILQISTGISYAQRRSSKTSLSKALKLANSGRYEKASEQLYRLSFSKSHVRYRTQIKYMLGLMLYQMELYQLAAFQFVSVIRTGDKKYLGQALEKLSLSADALGDDTLLNFAISRVDINKFPRKSRDMLFFRIGEIQQRSGQHKQAARSFRRVRSRSLKFNQAKYNEALSYAESGLTSKAIRSFGRLLKARDGKKVTDPTRVSALMGLARTYYQKGDWERSIDFYRRIPRDTPDWHETLFESSWAMMRSGKFRSALSNFQSLHSSFYEDFYIPESLLLRSIVYLYICKYDEMEKVLSLFDTAYKPTYRALERTLKSEKRAVNYYRYIASYLKDPKVKSKHNLPQQIVRKVAKEGDIRRGYQYIERLKAEQELLAKMPRYWKRAPIGKYARRVVGNRIVKAEKRTGIYVRNHFVNLRDELKDLIEQEGYIRFEMLNGKREALKKKVVGKTLPSSKVDESLERDFFIQNGFQYWPYSGENWLDELGNYHYLGVQSCE